MDASLDATTLEIQSLFYQGAYQACIDSAKTRHLRMGSLFHHAKLGHTS